MKIQIIICWMAFVGCLIGMVWFDIPWVAFAIMAPMTFGLTYGYYSGLFCKIGMHDFEEGKDFVPKLGLYVECTRCKERHQI